MDPQSQSFTPYTSSNDNWRLQTDVARIQQVQAEHSDRIARLERRQDDDARLKSVWGQGSPFPGVLSGTPQQAPLQHPSSDHFRNFDDEANQLMSSLHLDPEDEPRRGLGANSRANSVRFDETANQNHFSHSSRPSVEFMSRTSSGLGALQMTERSSSHKSEGRASSQHSIRSAASGRANSINLEIPYGTSDSGRSPLEHPGLAPGLLLLGSVPAIVRCWMNTNFKHDALLYAAVCTGSYRSFLNLPLIQKLGFEDRVVTSSNGTRTIELPVFFPEAVPHPASSRSSSPAPQLPTLTVEFHVTEVDASAADKTIQVFLGSDVLRSHSADILFSSNTMTLFDDERSKLNIPLVRPESEMAFKRLFITSGEAPTVAEKAEDASKDEPYLNGLDQASTAASISSTSPPPSKFVVKPTTDATEPATSEPSRGLLSSPEAEARPESRQSSSSRPPLSLLHTKSDVREQSTEAGSQGTPVRSGSSPAIWSNWRRDAGPASATNASTQPPGLDWANASRNRESSYQRKDTGIKVLKPKAASRAVSSTVTSTVPATGSSEGRSRFFDDGRRKNEPETKPAATEPKAEATPATPSTPAASTPVANKTKSNPIGGASAFSWLNPGNSAKHDCHYLPFICGNTLRPLCKAASKAGIPAAAAVTRRQDGIIRHTSRSKRKRQQLRQPAPSRHHSSAFAPLPTRPTWRAWPLLAILPLHSRRQGQPDKFLRAVEAAAYRHHAAAAAVKAVLSPPPPHLPLRSSAATRQSFRPSFATASSQKKRKLSPFGSIDTSGQQPYSSPHHPRDTTAAPSSPPSSPRRPANSASPSSSSSTTTRNTTPPRHHLPPHIQEEVLLARQSVEQISIDSEDSTAQIPHGHFDNHSEDRQTGVSVKTGMPYGARSASPAKRSAADMEGGDSQVPGSFTKETENETTSPVDQVMDETQDTTPDEMQDSARTNITAITSFESDAPPPYSTNGVHTTSASALDVPPIDEQVQTVYRIVQEKELDEGTRGYIVSSKWISRVWSRSSEALKDSKFPKEAREGPIGPVDNSDLVPEGAYLEPILKDTGGQSFIPIKPNLQLDEDYQIIPYEAWGLILTWYGNTLNQKPIVRYCHNTAPPEAAHPNFQYELEPPVITVRKIPQPHNDDGEKGRPSAQPPTALVAMRLREEQRGKGQLSPEDAVQLVSSKSERFNDFLKRAKEATGIARDHKVKIWRLPTTAKSNEVGPNGVQNGVLSPPDSRAPSPKGALAPESTLVLDLETWNKMDGSELIDAKDDTNNSGYNGRTTMSVYGLYENSTIALEEQIRGPGGGEYPSDSKKLGARLAPTKRILGSKPGSANPSGRTSPAPPSAGMMTRGRAKRDGRTRGTVGLTNLGNTCYMNSALQCIRSVEELAIYFLSGKFKTEINTYNPLGHNGAMAKRYAELLQSMYGDSAAGSITPAAFRKTLGSIQPMFSGYGQQDSQEFLSFLVDALHEDLNRIIKKPYMENPDSDDKTVHDPEAMIKLGETYRANHRARNDSVAMDLFSGFYKNTMECPVCDKISITFDPYSLLTLQLPIESPFQHDVTFVPLRGKPVNHAIDIDKNSSIKTLKEFIASKHPNVAANRLLMAEVYSHKIYKVFDDSTTLGEAGVQASDNLFMYELDVVPSNPAAPPEKRSMYSFSSGSKLEAVPPMDDAKADQFAVPVLSRQRRANGLSWEWILHPMWITVTRAEAQKYDMILKKILVAISRLTSRSILTEEGQDTQQNAAPTAELQDDDATAEEQAQISEHSVSSDEGYVQVSLEKTGESSNVAESTPADEDEHDDRPIPANFMDPEYFISPALRTNLFTVNFSESETGGLHCSGMGSIKESKVSNMMDRVQPLTRRSSLQSSTSTEESYTSTTFGGQVNGVIESDESDEDDLDAPDITLGGEETSYEGLPSLTMESSDEDLPSNPLQPTETMSRKGRRKQNKHSKKSRQLKTYGRAGQRERTPAGSLNSFQPQRGLLGKAGGKNEELYYIKLGEGIVLDWLPEGVDALFSGNLKDPEEYRGVFVSTPDGKDLPYIQDLETEAKRTRRETRKKHGITLGDCFAETGKRETLSEDNAWYCGRCKELRRARKTLEIWTIPDILVIHLKRFGGNRTFRDKIDVFVDYPIEGLDMTDKVGLKDEGKEYVYDLFAVDNHYGGLGGGHYTALAKNFYDGEWYDYNDQSCTRVSETRLHSAAAYLLFYRRRSDKPLGPQYLQDLVLEARNPHLAATEDGEEESDSGEGRLGGPIPSLLGSSSGLVGAGADPTNLRNGGSGLAGAGASASNSLITRTSLHHEHAIGIHHSGEPIFGPQQPPSTRAYGAQGTDWNFNGIDNAQGEVGTNAADTLVTNMAHGTQEEDDDAASTTAMLDDGRMQEDSQSFSPGVTPAGSDDLTFEDVGDDHGHYSGAHIPFQYEDGPALHLADAGRVGEDEGYQEDEAVGLEHDPFSPTEHDSKMD